MTKTQFTILLDEILNENDCKLTNIKYNKEGICKINYTDGVYDLHFYVAYRFMNRARLRFKIMNQLDLLEEIDPEWDLGF